MNIQKSHLERLAMGVMCRGESDVCRKSLARGPCKRTRADR